MNKRPEYLLFTEVLRHSSGSLMWRFLLLQADSDQTVTASDLVDGTSTARTELLALVRGLEAVDEPADIKLFTGSRYISRGLDRGLTQWRSQRWHWERFGRRVPIRDHDLWQRVDRAMEFHSVDCRTWGEPKHTAEAVAFESIEEPKQPEYNDSGMNEHSMVDDSAVLVVPRPKRVRLRRRKPTRHQRRQTTELLEPALLPTG